MALCLHVVDSRSTPVILLRSRIPMVTRRPPHTVVPQNLVARVDVFVPDDVILTQIAAGLHFNQHHGHLARVFHPMDGTQRDVDRLILGYEPDIIVDCDFCRAFDNNPMLRTDDDEIADSATRLGERGYV